MTAWLPELAWHVARDQALTDMADTTPDLGGPGVCAWTGVTCEETVPIRVSDNFDWASIARPASTRAHPGCAWLAGRSGITNDKGTRLRWSLFSLRASDQHGFEATNKAGKALIKSWVTDPPAGRWSVAVANQGQRHIAYRAPVNLSRDRYTIRFDELLIQLDRDEFRRLLTNVETVYAAGVTKAELAARSTSVTRLLALTPDAHMAWRQVIAHPSDTQLLLAVWLAQKEDA